MHSNAVIKRATSFDALLPPQVITVEATADMWVSGLYTEEAAYIKSAVESRRREFIAGRNCSRMALRMLDVEAVSIPVGVRRAPIFPFGISGSITHTNNYCAASVTIQDNIRSIGIDAESNIALGCGVRNMVMNSKELASIDLLPTYVSSHWDMLIFSAKEAFYKAYFQLCQIEIDFLDAYVSIFPDQEMYEIRLLPPNLPSYFTQQAFVGRYKFDELRVYTAMALLKS